MAGAWQSMVHRVIKSWTQLKQLSMHACTHIACRQWNLYGNHFGDITFYLFIHLSIHLDPLFSWIPNTFINLIYGEKSVINWGQGSVQFSRSVVSNSLRPRGLQHTRPLCPSPTPRVYSNSCPLSQWCHPTISSSVVPFPSHLQSFQASGSFQMSQFFASGCQSIGVSVSASVFPMNIQNWFPLGWTGWISLQSKGLSRVFYSTTVQKPQFCGAQLSLWFNSHFHTWLLEKLWLWLDGLLLAK